MPKIRAKASSGLLLVVIVLVMLSSRLHSINCPVCHHKVHVLSTIEQYMGPFKDIPSVHPQCANYLREVICPEQGVNMHQWFVARGYYYTKDQVRDAGVTIILDDEIIRECGF